MPESIPVIGSYVFYNGKAWNVSTIYRQCSSAHYGGMYYETLVWEWNADTRQRGELVYQDDGKDVHLEICKSILNSGAFWKVESNDA